MKMLTQIEQYAIDEVRRRRKALKFSQAALAAEAGLSYGFIGDVEAGKKGSKYNLNHLNAFAVALGCSIRDFIPETPFPIVEKKKK